MKHKIGDILYSLNSRYDDGTICDKKHGRYYIIDTGFEFLEIDETELQRNFRWDDND